MIEVLKELLLSASTEIYVTIHHRKCSGSLGSKPVVILFCMEKSDLS